MNFKSILRCLSLARPLGFFSVLVVCIILSGYVTNIEPLFRPVSDGPATHPITAIAFGLLGIGVLARKCFHKSRIAVFLGATVFVVALLRIVDFTFGFAVLDAFTPFPVTISSLTALGRPVSMGINSALTLMFLALALINCGHGRYHASQALAYIGLGVLFVGITGYAYGIPKFYGQMALTTILVGMPVGIAILFASAHRGFLRSILTPWAGGGLARMQILFGHIGPFLIGYALVYFSPIQARMEIGLLVTFTSVFTSFLVTPSAVLSEKNDRLRRSLECKLAVAATHDPLTGLPNRRNLIDYGHLLLDHIGRTPEPLSALMLDIDFFKQINDTYGHSAGDSVLQKMAEVIRPILRKQDFMARYGGEEFVILLPETPIDGAVQLAEKLRQRFSEALFPHGGRVTLSIGCAEFNRGESIYALIERADSYLYKAKSAGRNRVESPIGD